MLEKTEGDFVNGDACLVVMGCRVSKHLVVRAGPGSVDMVCRRLPFLVCGQVGSVTWVGSAVVDGGQAANERARQPMAGN